ncbi:MAG: hypothetical protein V4508_02325 [Pseudomonadota bacterium]
MAQVERVEDMDVGDFLQLPAQEWHLNVAAKAIYAQAQALTSAHQGDDPAPQFQVQNEPGPGFKARLERIR